MSTPVAPNTLAPVNTEANARLMTTLRRALVDRRDIIEIGDYKFRFQRRNEEFKDDGQDMRALDSGVFAKFPVTQGDKVIGGRWIHLGSTDDLEVLLAPYLPKSEQEREALLVGIGFNSVLKAVAKESREPVRRRPSPYDA